MRIAFLYPPFSNVNNQPNIDEVCANYGLFPPLSLAYVAANVQRFENELLFIDANALGLSRDEVLRRLEKFQPDVIMLTLTTYLFHQTLDYLAFLKKHLKAKTIVGGMHLELYPRETMLHSEVDVGVMGESELIIPKLMQALKKEKSLKHVKGVCYRHGKKIVVNPAGGVVENLDDVPNPARDLLPNERYYSFISRKHNFSGIVTSRGCLFRCIFCEQRLKKYRERSPKKVVDEFEECQQRFNINEFDVFDSSFTVNKRRVLDVCDEIVERKLRFLYSIRTRLDTVDEEILRALSDSGCYRIYFGIESGNPGILRNIKKESNITMAKKTVKLTKDHGIETFGYFMVGSPGETWQTIKQTVDLSKALDLDFAQFSKFSTLPGTEVYELWKQKFGYDYWREFLMDRNKDVVMPRYRCDLSEYDVERAVVRAYSSFYFRPGCILSRLGKVRTANELMRYFKASVAISKKRICCRC